MVTLDECIEFCREEAEQYRNAPKEIPCAEKKYFDEWQRRREIFETLARIAETMKNI